MEGASSATGGPNLARPGEAQRRASTAESRTMARAGALLFVVAAVVVAAPAWLPGSDPVDSTGLLAVAGALLACAALMGAAANRLPAAAFPFSPLPPAA